MKKALLMLSSVILMTGLSFSQKVDSIKVEQSGDFIKIRYKIVNSTIYQIYSVKVLCSMNSGMKTELRTVTGDIGDGILGGKNEYVVLWDVFKDVDELKSVEFFVRAQLIKDNTKINLPTDEKLLKRKIYIIAAGMIDGQTGHFGARFAYMNSWGVSAKLLLGKRDRYYPYEPFMSPAAGLDLTKRVIKNPDYQFHLLVGISAIKLQSSKMTEDPKTFFAFDAGFIFARKRILLGLDIFSVKESKVASQNTFGEIGLGIKF